MERKEERKEEEEEGRVRRWEQGREESRAGGGSRATKLRCVYVNPEMIGRTA